MSRCHRPGHFPPTRYKRRVLETVNLISSLNLHRFKQAQGTRISKMFNKAALVAFSFLAMVCGQQVGTLICGDAPRSPLGVVLPPQVAVLPSPPERSSSTPTGAGSTLPTGSTNCYTGNTWDATLCPDGTTCAGQLRSRRCRLRGHLRYHRQRQRAHSQVRDHLRPKERRFPVSTSWPATPNTSCSRSSTRSSPSTSMFPTSLRS